METPSYHCHMPVALGQQHPQQCPNTTAGESQEQMAAAPQVCPSSPAPHPALQQQQPKAITAQGTSPSQRAQSPAPRDLPITDPKVQPQETSPRHRPPKGQPPDQAMLLNRTGGTQSWLPPRHIPISIPNPRQQQGHAPAALQDRLAAFTQCHLTQPEGQNHFHHKQGKKQNQKDNNWMVKKPSRVLILQKRVSQT